MTEGGIRVLGFPTSVAFFSLLKPFPISLTTGNGKKKLLQNHYICSSVESLAMKTLDEADVGILCYISKLPGFRGILKHRYSDFIVNEVDCDGNVVHLTSFDLPPEESLFQRTEEKESLATTTKKSYTAEIETFRSLAGDIDAETLKDFLDQTVSSAVNDASHIVLSADSDKSHRTEIHNFFKKNFKFLITDTLDGPDANSKCIRVRFSSGSQSGQGRNCKKRKERGNRGDWKDDKPFDSRCSEDWPTGSGKFLRLHLYKENKDTQEALGLIGKMLGIQQRSFGFAGTKDKRSISTQRVTVFKQYAKRLAALNDRLIGIKVGNFCYVQEELVLGKLLGNRFTITLRGIVADSEDTIKASAEELGKNGFINYFGLQRFGSGSVPTHFVGAALLRGEWKTALGLILDPREGERDTIKEVREYYKESGDIDRTLRWLPRYLIAERAILQCLKKCPGNYLQALKAIPRTLRMMYVHSYQSYLWNHAASLRVQKYGFDTVVLGDLVYCKGNSRENLQGAVNTELEDCSYNDVHDDSGHLAETPEMALSEEKVHSVKVVDAEDLLMGEYTVDDIILPLPGSRTLYPSNDIVQVYHDLARKDGITLIESKHNVKEFSITSMTGGYRRVFQRPVDFEWEILRYTDCNMPLVETDLDVIGKSRPANTGGSKSGSSSNYDNCISESRNLGSGGAVSMDNHEDIGETEKLPQVESVCSPDATLQTALKLSFTLPSSSYATMAIRELLKTSTSVAYQKTLNPAG